MSSNHSEEYNLKIIIIGGVGEGKTSYLNRYINNTFSDKYKQTYRSQYEYKLYEKDDKLYNILFFEIPASEEDSHIIKLFSKNLHGCIIITDYSHHSYITRDNSIKLKNILDNSAKFFDGEKIPCIIVETKCDKLNNPNKEIFQEYAKENGFDHGFLVSSKTGENINESMEFLLNEIIKRIKKLEDGRKNMIKQKLLMADCLKEQSPPPKPPSFNFSYDKKYIQEERKKFNLKHLFVDNEVYFFDKGKNILEFSVFEEENSVYNNYSCEINFLALKEKHKIFKSVKDLDEFIQILKRLKEKHKIKIKLYIKDVVVQISITFFDIIGMDNELIFELVPESGKGSFISKGIIKEIIELNKKKRYLEKIFNELENEPNK